MKKRLEHAVINQTMIANQIIEFAIDKHFDEEDFIGALEVIVNIYKARQKPTTVSIHGVNISAGTDIEGLLKQLNDPAVSSKIKSIIERSLLDALSQSNHEPTVGT